MEDQTDKRKELVFTTEKATTSYANLCRGTMTPEEVILDFALNPNAFGKVLNEPIEVKNRVVLSFPAAKRLLYLLNDIVNRHQQVFGEIEIDVNRRVRNPSPEAAAQ